MNIRALLFFAMALVLSSVPAFSADKSKKAADDTNATSWTGTIGQDGQKLVLHGGTKGTKLYVLVAAADAPADVKKTLSPDNKEFGKSTWTVGGKMTEDDGRQTIHVDSIKVDPTAKKKK